MACNVADKLNSDHLAVSQSQENDRRALLFINPLLDEKGKLMFSPSQKVAECVFKISWLSIRDLYPVPLGQLLHSHILQMSLSVQSFQEPI